MSELSTEAQALIDAAGAEAPSAALKAQIKANVVAEVGVAATGGAAASGGLVKLLFGGTLAFGLVAGAVISTAPEPVKARIEPTRFAKVAPAVKPVPATPVPVAPVAEVSTQNLTPEPAAEIRRPIPAKVLPPRRSKKIAKKDAVVTAPPIEARTAVSGLAEEARLLKRMRIGLREGQFALVLELAHQHEAHFAEGALVVERWAAQALAECGLGHPAKGLALRARLATRAPTSVHLVRIDEACQHSVR
jgi:hypothetical protein